MAQSRTVGGSLGTLLSLCDQQGRTFPVIDATLDTSGTYHALILNSSCEKCQRFLADHGLALAEFAGGSGYWLIIDPGQHDREQSFRLSVPKGVPLEAPVLLEIAQGFIERCRDPVHAVLH